MEAEEAVKRMLQGKAKDHADAGTDNEAFPRPEPGSAEEKAFLEAAWQQPEIRAALFEKYGEQLEALGFKRDGALPTKPAVPGMVGSGEKRGLAIIPEPGFVIKTKTLETGEKVFINMCRSTKVRSFSHEKDPNNPEAVRVRIPLSLGPKRNDLDKSGEPCIVYDVVFNTEVIEQALLSKELKDFLIGLALSWIMEKEGGGLDVNAHTIVKLRGNYKGASPVMQVVRADSLIQEVEDESEEQDPPPMTGHAAWEHAALNPPSRRPPTGATRRAAHNANYADSVRLEGPSGAARAAYVSTLVDELQPRPVERPAHALFLDAGRGPAAGEGLEPWRDGLLDELPAAAAADARALVLKLDMPRVESAREADVNIVGDVVMVEVEGKYDFEMTLPLPVDDQVADATFDRTHKRLILTLPLKSWTTQAYQRALAARTPPQPAAADTAAGPAAAAGAGKGRGKTEFETKLQERLHLQSAASRLENGDGEDKPIRYSHEEKVLLEKQKQGAVVSDRRPFECRQCQWRAVATAVRQCRRCRWVEPGSKEEAIMLEQVREQEMWRASRKLDEVGHVDETGGVENKASIRAFAFKSRFAYELDVDEPSWLQAIREEHYGPGTKPKLAASH